MTTAHAVIGIATAASLLALVLWAIGAKIVKRAPGPSYERVARVPIALLVLQIVFGIALVASGERRPALHYVYGALALIALVAGAALARALHRDRWVVIAWSAFIAALLLARALMTGYRTR